MKQIMFFAKMNVSQTGPNLMSLGLQSRRPVVRIHKGAPFFNSIRLSMHCICVRFGEATDIIGKIEFE